MRAYFPQTPFKAVFWKVVTSSYRASKYLAKNIETLTWWNLIIIPIISWYFWQVLKSSSVLITRINYNQLIRLGSAKTTGKWLLSLLYDFFFSPLTYLWGMIAQRKQELNISWKLNSITESGFLCLTLGCPAPYVLVLLFSTVFSRIVHILCFAE